MPRTFKQWIPSAAEIELLHECWLGRLPPAVIAARLGISEPKLMNSAARPLMYYQIKRNDRRLMPRPHNGRRYYAKR
jgi:hypothetical protein